MMAGSVVEDVSTHKYLGVTLTKDFNWREHIESMTSSASKCLDVLNALKYKIDLVTLQHLYVAFIRSKLEYAATVVDNITQELSDLVKSIQYRAGKIISGIIHQASQDLVYKDLGGVLLNELHQKKKLKVVYNMVNNGAPSYLSNIVSEAE